MKAKQETYMVGGLRDTPTCAYPNMYDFRSVLELVDYGQITLASIRDQVVSGSQPLGRRLNSRRLAYKVNADYYKCSNRGPEPYINRRLL